MYGLTLNEYTQKEVLSKINKIFGVNLKSLKEWEKILNDFGMDPLLTKYSPNLNAFLYLPFYGHDVYYYIIYSKNKQNETEYKINSTTTKGMQKLHIAESKYIPELNAIFSTIKLKPIEKNIDITSTENTDGLSNILNELKENRIILPKEDINIIANLLKSYSKTTAKFLGGGIDGLVFKIAPGMVLKIFKNLQVYNNYKQIYDLLWSQKGHKNDVMIYDIGKFSIELFWVLMEELNTKPFHKITHDDWDDLEETLKDNPLINNLYEEFTKILKHEDFENTSKLNKKIIEFDLKTRAKEIAGQILDEEYENAHMIIREIFSKQSFYEYLISFIINYCSQKHDLHKENIGMRHDVPIFFDPTYDFPAGKFIRRK